MPRGGPRSASRRSDISDIDADQQIAENELAKLQRQYRVMEGDRNAYNLESQDLIRRQVAEVSTLEDEKKELLKDLVLSDSQINQSRDNGNIDRLNGLCAIRDDYNVNISEEKEQQHEIERKIRQREREINNQHREMGGVHASGQHTQKTQKAIRVKENRLDQAKRQFNSMLTENAKFREDIDSLRVERARFENLRKKLEKTYADLRQEIGEVIDQSTQAYDTRDEAQAKMILLKDKADKDCAQHQQEMKELQRVIDHDRKLREFMTVKSKEREEDELLVAQRQKREAEEGEKLRRERQEDSIEAYEGAFKRITEITGETDLNKLVNKFIEVEDRNFALFNFVNEQNNEIEMQQEQIEEIQGEIHEFNEQGLEMEEQRKSILKDLESKQTQSAKDADNYDAKMKGVNKILDQLKAGVESLFSKTSCDRSTINDMLGSAAGVSDATIMQYLGLIEQRTNELLAVGVYVDSKAAKEKDDVKVPSMLGKGPVPPPQQLMFMAPSTGDDYDSDQASDLSDEETRPLTQNELKSRIMKGVLKKEAAASKKGFQYDLSVPSKDLKQKQSISDKKRVLKR